MASARRDGGRGKRGRGRGGGCVASICQNTAHRRGMRTPKQKRCISPAVRAPPPSHAPGGGGGGVAGGGIAGGARGLAGGELTAPPGAAARNLWISATSTRLARCGGGRRHVSCRGRRRGRCPVLAQDQEGRGARAVQSEINQKDTTGERWEKGKGKGRRGRGGTCECSSSACSLAISCAISRSRSMSSA